jgi:tetratricopeptide (TPR) repeat protein
MRPLPLAALLAVALAASAVLAFAAQDTAPAPQGPGAPGGLVPGPGGPMMGPMMGPDGPMGRPGMMPGGRGHDPADEEPSELDKLASQRWRPTWAPLPLLRGEVATLPYIHELLKSTEPANRARAAFLMGQIACPDSRRPLAARLADQDRGVRVQAGIALACMGDPRGLDTCQAVLRNDPDWIRYYAVVGLWTLNTPAARRALEAAQEGQAELLSTTLKAALKSPYVPAPAVKPLAAGARVSPRPTPTQTWEQAGDVMIRESDWWWHQGNYDQAIRASEVSILMDPAYVDTYTTVAWLQWSMGRDPAAIATLHRAIKAAPRDPDSHFGLGFHYFNTNRYRQAEGFLRDAVNLGGGNIAQRMYAHCLERLGKLQESCNQWRAVLKANPADGAAAQNLERINRILAGPKVES